MSWFNKLIVWILPIFPKSFIWIFSRRYISGKKLEDGIQKAKDLNAGGCLVTMDILGEYISDLSEADTARNECLVILEAIRKEKINGNLSLKLSQLGLNINRETCYQNVKAVVQKAAETGSFVRIDMEDSAATDATIEIYRRLRKDFKNVGLVIQAYLKRSEDDVRRLIGEGNAHLRICKGIYQEPASIAFKNKQAIRDNYLKLVQMMLDSGSYVGLATHDKILIDRLLEIIEEKKIPQKQFEFQMLLGVTEHLRDDLVGKGYALRVYVPYGDQWYGYCLRRMKENPQVAGHVMKNLFIRG